MTDYSTRAVYLNSRARHPASEAVRFVENRIVVAGQSDAVYSEQLDEFVPVQEAVRQDRIRYSTYLHSYFRKGLTALSSVPTCGNKLMPRKTNCLLWSRRCRLSWQRKAQTSPYRIGRISGTVVGETSCSRSKKLLCSGPQHRTGRLKR